MGEAVVVPIGAVIAIAVDDALVEYGVGSDWLLPLPIDLAAEVIRPSGP